MSTSDLFNIVLYPLSLNLLADSQSRPTSALSRPSTAPAKKKVIETEPEPSHSVIEDSEKAVPFVISGVVDYCKYQCNFKEIKFKDTLMYQTRRYR